MSFDPAWLALREPADHRARHGGLLRQLARHFDDREEIAVVDLGCGTGSNLRALAARLPERQAWTLVDHDPALLDAARDRLSAWADAVGDGPGLALRKDGRRIAVSFVQADLARDVERVLGEPDLVTAAALFDLVSAEWIGRFVQAVAERGAAFYTALTYDGTESWEPPHPDDGAMRAAFHAHQHRDKGFGAAAGPDATELLVEAFCAADYTVETGASPWRLGPADRALVAELARGVAGAVRETGRVPEARVADWLAHRREASCTVGHLDLLALPA